MPALLVIMYTGIQTSVAKQNPLFFIFLNSLLIKFSTIVKYNSNNFRSLRNINFRNFNSIFDPFWLRYVPQAVPEPPIPSVSIAKKGRLRLRNTDSNLEKFYVPSSGILAF